MTHGILTEPSLSPHSRKGREGNREGNGGLGSPSIDSHPVAREAANSATAAVGQAASMDGLRHVHQFVPVPVGTDGRDRHESPHPQRFRNRCSCGHWQTPRRLGRGPACRRCGFPTVPAITDPDLPLHPCCAEPELMALGTRRRNR